MARATGANLGTSKTVYGVTKSVSGGGTPVDVLVSGEAFDAGLFPGGSPMLSGTGAGNSHVVATDITQGSAANQCKLIRVERPNGSEHVVGTCDENGNIIVQPRASRDTSPQHVFNVCAYGARGDGRRVDDGTVASGALGHLTSALANFTSADLSRNIQIVGAGPGGATLTTTIAAVNSATDVTLAVAATLAVTLAPTLIWGHDAAPAIAAAVSAIPDGGGILFFPGSGSYVVESDPAIPARVQVMFDEGARLTPTDGTTATLEGLVRCHENQYVFDGLGSYLLPSAFDRFNVRHFGATPDWDGASGTDNLRAFNATLAAAKAALSYPTHNVAARMVAKGHYYLGGTLEIEQTILLEGDGMQEPTLYAARAAPATWLVFPANTTGIRIHSAAADDGGAGIPFLTQVGTTTTLQGGANFTASSVGRSITISNSSTPGNNGTFTIETLLSSTSVSWTNAAGATDHGVATGTTASLVQSASDTTTLTGGAGFTPDMVGNNILISGSASPANNGIFGVVSFIDATSLAYGNGNGVTDAGGGVSYGISHSASYVPAPPISYSLGGGFGDGSKTRLRDLTLFCKDAIDPVTNFTGHGVHATATFTMENVTIEKFALDGVFINGSYATDFDGNADGSMLVNVVVGACGRDGIHLQGADATGCTILNCQVEGNRRYGFFDKARSNAYVGCLSEYNADPAYVPPAPTEPPLFGALYGSNYHTEGSAPRSSGYNSANFLGCYSEGNAPGIGRENQLFGDVNVLGGTLGGSYVDPRSTGFVLNGGLASQAPLAYTNDRNGAGNRILFSVGTLNASAPDAFEWATPDPPNTDYSTLTYNLATHWWELINSSPYRKPISFPTSTCNARQAAPRLFHGLFLGGDPGGVADLSFIASPNGPPNTEYIGLPLTYEIGDVVWNCLPTLGAVHGQVCVQRGTQTTLNGGATTTTVDIATGDPSITVSDASGLAVGQYLQIAGLAGIYKVTSLAGTVVGIDPVAAAPGVVHPAAVDYSPAVFGQIGRVEALGSTISPINGYVASAGEQVVLTTAGNTVDLPAAPAADDEVSVMVMTAGLGSVTVDAGANAIYNGTTATTDTLADDASVTYRWIAIGGGSSAWKRR